MTQVATFAAGCFWGVEHAFSRHKGVVSTAVGYMGGTKENPTYEDVCSDTTGHAEVCRLEYDPDIVTYGELLEAFFDLHDPTTPNRQGPDVGTQYRSAIFYYDDRQKSEAREYISKLESSGRYQDPIVTEVTPASTFWRAEEYHQKYFEKNESGGCRRR